MHSKARATNVSVPNLNFLLVLIFSLLLCLWLVLWIDCSRIRFSAAMFFRDCFWFSNQIVISYVFALGRIFRISVKICELVRESWNLSSKVESEHWRDKVFGFEQHTRKKIIQVIVLFKIPRSWHGKSIYEHSHQPNIIQFWKKSVMLVWSSWSKTIY